MKQGYLINSKYEVISELGRGGMGVVYRARHRNLGRDVAVKILKDALSAESQLRAQREGLALASIKHPNLVGVHALEQDEAGRMVLVFDYVDGVPLSALLGDGTPIEVTHASALFAQLCAGLEALHSSGFIHRDIKPSNLMICGTIDGAAPHLVIIDFGLAKHLDPSVAKQKLTSTGAVLGTPVYMSPEQFGTAPASPQSDNYSAACVLYEMLTGSPPFNDESVYILANAHLTLPPPAVPANLPNHHALDAFFAKALAKDPNLRFSDADSMNRAFSDAVSRHDPGPARARKGSAAPRAPRMDRRLSTAIVISAALLVLAAAAASPNFFPRHKLDYAAAETQAVKAWHKINQQKSLGNPKAVAYAAAEVQNIEKNYESGGPQMAALYQQYTTLLLSPNAGFPPADYDAAVTAMERAVPAAERGTNEHRWTAYCALFKTYEFDGRWVDAYNMLKKALRVKYSRIMNMEPRDLAVAVDTLERAGKFDELLSSTAPAMANLADEHGIGPDTVRRNVAQAYIWKGNPKMALKVLGQTEYYTEDLVQTLQRDVPVALAAAALGNDKRSWQKYIGLSPANYELYLNWTYQTIVPAAYALNDANGRRPAAVTKTVDTILSMHPQNAPPSEVVHMPQQRQPDRQRQYLLALFLCKEASKRIGDTDRQTQCTNRIKQINDELVKHNRIFPGVFS